MYWLVYFFCLSYSPVCIQVNIHPAFRTLEACEYGAAKLEDHTYREVVEALVGQGIPLQGPMVIHADCELHV